MKFDLEVWKKIQREYNYSPIQLVDGDCRFECSIVPTTALTPCMAVDNVYIELLGVGGVACAGRIGDDVLGKQSIGFQYHVIDGEIATFVSLFVKPENYKVGRIREFLHSKGIMTEYFKENVVALLTLREFRSLCKSGDIEIKGVFTPVARRPISLRLLWCDEVATYRWFYKVNLETIIKNGFVEEKLESRKALLIPTVRQLNKFSLV